MIQKMFPARLGSSNLLDHLPKTIRTMALAGRTVIITFSNQIEHFKGKANLFV